MCHCWFKKLFGGKCNCECKCCHQEEKQPVNSAPATPEAKPTSEGNVEKTQ